MEKEKLSAQQQLDMLNAAEDSIKTLKTKLMNETVYCDACKKLYFKEETIIDSQLIKKLVCSNPLTGGYLDPYNYTEEEVTVFCRICPKEHRISKYTENFIELL